MKKMRLHIYIAMAVFVIMIIIGSFLDLQINQALFSNRNGFGITVAALSMNVGYAVIAFMGGVTLFHGLKIAKVTWQKVMFIILSLGYLGISIYFDAKEFFGSNGWYILDIKWVGYFIATPIMGAAMAGGYFVGRKANNPRLWLLMLVGVAFIGFSLIIGTTVVKSIFHRPRYRLAVYGEISPFFAWWERCGNYEDLMAKVADKYNLSLEVAKEEFKSFPSGHTSVCSLGMLFVIMLPFITGKELKHQIIYFYVALAYALFVAFTRMLVGAHYLSDVGMGGLITTVCLYGYYEVILHEPRIYQEPVKEEAQE